MHLAGKRTASITSPIIYHNVQNYIKELEISEGQLSSCLKSVYENRQKDEFMKRLEDRVKHYDSEIERLCSKNYQSFVETFNEFLSVREDTATLKDQLIANNEKIQKIGKNLINKVEDLVQETKKQNNILAAIEALNKHMPVFHIYRQLQMQMKQKKYYPALKLLEDLESNYLPLVKHYRFSESIHQSIPLFKEHIKTDTINELNSFLDSLRVQTEKVGKIANIQMAHKMKIHKKHFLLESELNKNDIDQEIEQYLKKLPFDVIDFSPLYRNLHMNQVLGAKSNFSDYYCKQREKQLKLTLQEPAIMESMDINENEALDSYKRYFHTVAGFFVIEDQILSTTENLVDGRYLRELFDKATPRLISVIRRAMEQCKDAEMMLKVKIIVVLFCNTIEEVQFPTIQLSDLLKEIRDKYYNMLLAKWDEKIKNILREDNYTCLEFTDEESYNQLIEAFPCQLDDLAKSEKFNPKSDGKTFFRVMPYSICVPKIFAEIKGFVANCAKFAEGLNSSKTELDDMIRKPTNKLITDRLNENIQSLISVVSLTQLVQVVLNTIYLEKSIELLEQHLLEIINASTSKQSGKLQGISVFRDLRNEAEVRIYELLNDKIDELLDLESFNWLMADSQGQASDYMKSLLHFLNSNLDSFKHIPSKLAQTACVSACKHIAQSLMAQMTNPNIKAINMGAFQQLNLDLLQCETFASTVRINEFDNETILMCFVDIRQLIDLVLSKEWSIYLKDYGKPNNKYDRVQASVALNILEKLKEGAKKGKGLLFRLDLSSNKAPDRDDIKLFESVAKQLRTLTQAQNF